ncbi:GCN5-related N-acetyltransferase [Allomeiothermus silvanus DSM 9946]|uniref:GCN5-related N-acetyltransferase n=1 Tax=Allomeiothermus silvanus (strain ATCC 700542 / DSM 9946 / NBRC 106475 / NCIMB 13440 / VI-R2) TaxID=526227 RepID=D7BG74_ALLS1|nr:GNAT family N-acetyltransferase [Allomeiothermus silvanus]ADH61995.1 GCN5-related N-acetyltransferase [Allomeiothermus silvanus DSM 9946]
MSLLIRLARKPQDFLRVAEILNAVEPEWPVTAGMLEHWDKNHDPKYHRAEFVAELDAQIVGLGSIGEDRWAYEPGKFVFDIQVHPEFQGRGVGRAIYDHLIEHVQLMNPTLLQVGTRENRPRARAFLERRGFVETWRRYESWLETRDFDCSLYTDLAERVKRAGLEIKSWGELSADPDAPRKLWELDWLLLQDVPMGLKFVKRDLEQWIKEEIQDPHFVPQACFIALDPNREDPLTGSYVGYSQLTRNPAGFWGINMTGVLREYRGKGVAKALKLEGIRYVKEHGGEQIRTTNDPPNSAMLAMNLDLGFRRQPSLLRYQKALDGRKIEPFDAEKYMRGR